ncbi:LPO_1073/Vpar_1526 family protein [Rudanella lutea]|uniref:LPO_1073/Vpar_1526 family protein n=1 Tax=Rudanella lutea TaxID=451374 RepID=UPI000368FC6F|nr:LPO_1073/Vpar_1526 family protein [Rudanella lutea]
MFSKQIQESGDNSQQLQANNMIVNIGIDEKRAREIYQEMNLQLRKDYTQEALEIANLRVTEFENRLLPKMEAVEGALEAFADPSFQLLLVEAQKTAASTERTADYDLLSELLIHRFQKGDNRVTRAGISRAVEIVDKISDDALLGLTVLHSVNYFLPASGIIHQGLSTLNDLFGKLFYSDLPVGIEWLDHLDILDAIRVSNFSSLKKLEEYYPEMLSGYIDTGIEKNSDNYNEAIELLRSNGLPQDILIDHELNGNYVRIKLSNIDQIDSLILHHKIFNNGRISFTQIPLTHAQKIVVKSVYDLYEENASIRQQNVNKFMEEWNKQPNLNKLREWWDSINAGIQLTSVGKVLAHSNAQRCDKNLPSLN